MNLSERINNYIPVGWSVAKIERTTLGVWAAEAARLKIERDDLEEHWADEVGEKQKILKRYTKVIQENKALRDELYEKSGKAFWEGHMRGRIYGREGISKEEMEACAKWLDALLKEQDDER